MMNSSRKSKLFFKVFAAASVVIAADMVTKDSEQNPLAKEAVVAAPAEITGIQAPIVGYLSSLEDARIIPPELKTPALSAPALPDLELVVWRSDGVIPAPRGVIEVDPPDVGFLPSLEDSGRRGLVRPPLNELRR
jgi:hypothetical protein